MRLTREEIARLNAMTGAWQAPPALPGLGEEPTTVAALVRYRRARLKRGRRPS